MEGVGTRAPIREAQVAARRASVAPHRTAADSAQAPPTALTQATVAGVARRRRVVGEPMAIARARARHCRVAEAARAVAGASSMALVDGLAVAMAMAAAAMGQVAAAGGMGAGAAPTGTMAPALGHKVTAAAAAAGRRIPRATYRTHTSGSSA